MTRLWFNVKEIFALDALLGRALADSDVSPEIYILAGRIKAAIEELHVKEEP